MLEFFKRPALVLLAGVMVVLSTGAGLMACATGTSDDSPDVNPVHRQVITPETIARLRAGEQLVVDMRTEGAVYEFDFSRAPLDFSRISLINVHGNSMPMSQWLSAVRQQGRDLLATPRHLFRLSSPERAPEAGTVSALSEECIKYELDEWVCYGDESTCHWEYHEIVFCYDVPDPEP
jgi:hypothetical protein